MKILLFVCILSLSGCASFKVTSGEKQIQKKCHSVIGSIEDYVCEQP